MVTQVNLDHCVERAAEDLSCRLEGLAVQLAARMPLRRMRYGPAVVRLLKRQSPQGFLLESAHGDFQLLLPDGRIWEYRRSSAEGRYYDARVDYVDFVHSRLRVDGSDFAYLGAAIGKYSFGVASHDRQHRATPSGSLCALKSSDTSRLVSATFAFAEIANGLMASGHLI